MAYQEYPKMLYLHPADKTQVQSQIVVANSDDEKAAVGKGYKLLPHIPTPVPENTAKPIPVYFVDAPLIPVPARVAGSAHLFPAKYPMDMSAFPKRTAPGKSVMTSTTFKYANPVPRAI